MAMLGKEIDYTKEDIADMIAGTFWSDEESSDDD